MMPPAPKPPTTLSPSLTIDATAVLTGTHPIILGNNTVIHPRTRFTSTHGPITVGNGCIIGERVTIGLQKSSTNQAEGVNIENGVVIEVGATIEARVIGEGSQVEVNAVIGRGSTVGKHCKIGPLCTVAENETVPDYTVIFCDGTRRVDRSGVEELKAKMVAKQVDVLRRLIPTNLSKFQ